MRQQRIFRLEIVYPEGSHEPGWRPSCWAGFLASLTWQQRRVAEKAGFRWPRERMFLSSSGAYKRANLLRWYGAEAEVFASDPVTWPNYDDAASLGPNAWEHPDVAMHWTPGHKRLADHLDRQRTAEFVAALQEPVPS